MPILTFRPALMPHPYQSSLMIGVDVWADREIIGTGWLTRWGDVAEISDLFIAPPYRNFGAGTALIRHLAEIGELHGAKWLEIGVDEGNSSAKRLYERLGFVAYHIVPAHPEPIIYLRCPIDSLLNS